VSGRRSDIKGLVAKWCTIDKIGVSANTTSAHTTSIFTAITENFTRTTSITIMIQYGKYSEVSFVQRFGK